MIRMRYAIPVIILLIALLIGAAPVFTAHAQQLVSLSALRIELWPEYDQRNMLVLYRMTLSSSVSLPAELTLRIPADGDLNAVAVRSMDGGLFSVANSREVRGEWAYITFTATEPDIQIEYYDPKLEINGTDRSFDFRWPGDYAVGDLTLMVQQPIGAVNVNTSPKLGNTTQDDSGLVYHASQVGSLNAGEAFDLNVTYQKTSNTLTVDSFGLEPTGPLDETTSGRVTVTDMLPWGLGALGVIVIAGGFYWYWLTSREAQPQKKAAARRRRRSTATRVASEFDDDTPENGVFCHQCGKRAAGGDRFCRACGTKLR